MPKMAFKHQEKVVRFCVVILAYWYRAVCSSYISIYQVETIFPFTEIRVYKIINQSFFFFWPCHETCKILVPWPRIKLAPLALEGRSLNYWTTREVPVQQFWSHHQKRSGTHLLHRSSSFQPGWERNGKWERGRESGLTQETEAGATKLWDEGEAQGFYLIHTICKISSV